MNTSDSFDVVAKKSAVLLLPVFILLFVLSILLKPFRKYVTRTYTGLNTAVEKENLVVYAPERHIARNVIQTFFKFEDEIKTLFGDHVFVSKKRLKIHIFPDKDSMSNYFETKFHEPLDRNDGFFDASDNAIALTYPGENHLASFRRTLRHEAIHFFLENGISSNQPNWSPWFNEGLAMVLHHYERSSETDTWFLADHKVKQNIIRLSKQEFIPFRNLLTMKEKKFREKNNKPRYYQSQLLVYFLLNKYRKQFWNYFQLEKQRGGTSIASFEQTFNKELSQIESEFREWLDQGGEAGWRSKKMEGEIR